MSWSVRWRRVDLPGTDEARLDSTSGGRRLSGMARFRDHDGAVALDYVVDLAENWATRTAIVTGTTPAGPVLLMVKAGPDGTWTFNGDPAPAVAGCVDFDLGFTPATNLLSIRRLDLVVGARAEVTVAWLPSLHAPTLQPLRQVYDRIADDLYRYSCPDLPFDSTLRVDEAGFVLDYPPLWEEGS
jgi:hypothetical protein